MTLQVRPVGTELEHLRYLELNTVAFGGVPSPPTVGDEELHGRLHDRSREFAALDGDRVVGGFYTYDLGLTLPGGAIVPAAGLAGVAVDGGSLGQGWLHRMLDAHLADARERGEVVSLLTSSESGLYRRYGYGWATSYAVFEADAAESRLEHEVANGRLELITDPAEARSQAAEAYRRVSTVRSGTTSRSDAWWEVVYGPERTWLGGGPQLTVIHRDTDGAPDGYLLYVADLAGGGWHGVPGGTVQVRELLGASAEVELALWDRATRVPLTRRVRWELAPVDSPVRWWMRDPRQLRTIAWRDMLWLRVLDVAALLEGRSYEVDGRVTFEVQGPDDDPVSGTWTLAVSEGVGRVSRGGRPEVSLDLASLGSVALGGIGMGELSAAGRVTGDRVAVARMAALFRTAVQPFSLSRF